MKRGFIGWATVALVAAVLACAQAVAGEMPSQSGAVAPRAQVQANESGLTAEQAVALAAVEPGGAESYGSETVDMTVVYVVVVVVVVATAVALAAYGL